jgi:hypothetical protein
MPLRSEKPSTYHLVAPDVRAGVKEQQFCRFDEQQAA